MNNHVPASCDLHVLLEAIAGSAQECRLTYINQEGRLVRIQGQILSIYVVDDIDWCKLRNGSIVRLDRIETIEELSHDNWQKKL